MPFHRTVKPNSIHSKGEKERKINEIVVSSTDKDVLSSLLIEELRPRLLYLIEKSFRQYCKLHHADKEMEDREWKRFKSVLLRRLG